MLMKILVIISIILLASVLICGMWIGTHSDPDPAKQAEAVKFHKQLGILTVVVSIFTLLMVLFKLKG